MKHFLLGFPTLYIQNNVSTLSIQDTDTRMLAVVMFGCQGRWSIIGYWNPLEYITHVFTCRESNCSFRSLLHFICIWIGVSICIHFVSVFVSVLLSSSLAGNITAVCSFYYSNTQPKDARSVDLYVSQLCKNIFLNCVKIYFPL